MNEEEEHLLFEIIQAIVECLKLIRDGRGDHTYKYLESIEWRLERLEAIEKSHHN